jgi:pimeloyl-ACP methyl ester carboxylesterase
MPVVKANGIQIEYDTFGEKSSPALLLIIGLGGQMIHWDEAFCESLAEKDFFVIRFDNRDTGLSTKFDEAGLPDIMGMVTAMMAGKSVVPPYTLEDMAEDTAGLLDALGIKRAHVCGMSMGGMIAQTLALRNPQRFLSLTSIYSTTGNPDLPQPRSDVAELLMTPTPLEREAAIEHSMKIFKTISGSGFPFDESWHRNILGRSYDRAFYPQGVIRQFAAILTQKNRKSALSSLSIPTLVVHGTDDPLVPIECGRDTAKAIPGSEFLSINGMGHDLPHGGAWPRIAEAMIRHIKRSS